MLGDAFHHNLRNDNESLYIYREEQGNEEKLMSKLRDKYDKFYIDFALWFAANQHIRDFAKLEKQAKPIEDFDKKFSEIVVPYWKQFNVRPRKSWYRVYWDANKSESPYFIPNDLWLTKILPHFNTVLFSKGALQDKCLHNVFLPGIQRPETVCKNIAGVFYDDNLTYLNEKEILDRIKECENLIIKPSVGTSQGYGISFFNGSLSSEKEIREILKKYNRNYIIQKVLKQHEKMAMLNKASVNTVRVISFFYKGEIYHLSSILRIGGKTSRIDNVSQGGYQCTINPNGTLTKMAYAYRDGIVRMVDKTDDGIVFDGFTIPAYDEIIELIDYYAPKMGHFKVLGWDFAIDENGKPVFIEYNTLPGQNQMTCGPTFGAYTDEILKEVFNKK